MNISIKNITPTEWGLNTISVRRPAKAAQYLKNARYYEEDAALAAADDRMAWANNSALCAKECKAWAAYHLQGRAAAYKIYKIDILPYC